MAQCNLQALRCLTPTPARDLNIWLITNFGFFSLVQKDASDDLTIRSRTKSDLDRLRNH